ncbi:MAG: recombination mediator RecR, partial [Bacteroidia bacterium]
MEQAVDTFARLPGVGKKTALRYVLHLIKESKEEAGQFAQLIHKLKTDLKFCNN